MLVFISEVSFQYNVKKKYPTVGTNTKPNLL